MDRELNNFIPFSTTFFTLIFCCFLGFFFNFLYDLYSHFGFLITLYNCSRIVFCLPDFLFVSLYLFFVRLISQSHPEETSFSHNLAYFYSHDVDYWIISKYRRALKYILVRNFVRRSQFITICCSVIFVYRILSTLRCFCTER